MKCLHSKPAAHSTTQNGSFWFCHQNPSCNLFCCKDEGYLYEKAITAWRAMKQPHPRCGGHNKLAKMRVVRDLMKASYGRPFFVCSDKLKPCSFWVWGDVRPLVKPEYRHGLPCMIRKVKKKVSIKIDSAVQMTRNLHASTLIGCLRSLIKMSVLWNPFQVNQPKSTRNITWQTNS